MDDYRDVENQKRFNSELLLVECVKYLRQIKSKKYQDLSDIIAVELREPYGINVAKRLAMMEGREREMTVYIAQCDDSPCPGIYILGVFSTPELAHEYLLEHPSQMGNDCVTAWKVDKEFK